MTRLSLGGRVILCVVIAQVAVLGIAGWLLWQNARQSIAVEIEASRTLARNYAIASVASLMRSQDPAAALRYLPEQLQQPRHVRIQVIDALNGIIDTAPAAAPDPLERAGVPDWFVALMSPRIEQTALPIRIQGRVIGVVIITTAPGDELAEVWLNLRSFAIVAGIVCLLLSVSVILAVRRALRPLGDIARAFERLEAGDFGARVPAITIPDLRDIARRFNSLAESLAKHRADKDALNRRLVTVQDTERKAIARELHDEFGPCLFGIKVEASAIADAAARLPGPDGTFLAERAASVLSIAEQIQRSNRALLQQLRPMAIGQLPLPQVMDELLGRFIDQCPDIDWEVDIDPTVTGHDETTELTLYRVLQEAVTNALRHAGPTRLTVSVRWLDEPRSVGADAAGQSGTPWIVLQVTDDGCGLPSTWQEGIGTRGMRERVEGVGGRFRLSAGQERGTVLEALIPASTLNQGSGMGSDVGPDTGQGSLSHMAEKALAS